MNKNIRLLHSALAFVALILLNIGYLQASSLTPPDSSEVNSPCDSIVIPIDTLSYCVLSNALPFTFEDSSLTESGFYFFHHVTEAGCDSDIVVHLTVKPYDSDSRTVRISVCANELPYIIHNTALTQTGQYTFHMQASDGCDSISVINFVVLPAPTVSIIGGGYLCPDTTMTLSYVGTARNTIQWSTGSDSSSIVVDSAGVYSLTVTSVAGCIGTDSAVVIAAGYPEFSISGPADLCWGETATLSVTEGFQYLWDDSTSFATRTVSPWLDTTYYVSVTDTVTSCHSNDSISIHINPLPTASITGSPLEVCEGDSVLLTAAGGVQYIWSTGETTESIYVKASGTYRVTVTNEFGCTDTASIYFKVNPLPVIDILGSTTFCQNQSTTITLTGASTYNWSNGSTGPSFTTNTTGSYTVTCTDSHGCVSVVPVQFTYSIVQANLTGSTSFCQGKSTVLKVVGDSTNTYQWINGNQTDSMVISSIGQVSVLVTNTLGCTVLLTANITELTIPNPSITCTQGSLTFCEGNSATLRASGGLSYQWSNGSTTNSIIVREEGTYTVTVTAMNGCTAETSETVIVNPTPEINIVSAESICAGDQVTIHAIAPTGRTFSWSSGQTTPSITVQPSQGISYYMVTVVDNNNCSNTESITINTIARPTVLINGMSNGNITICQNTNTALNASAGSSYHWSNGLSYSTIYVNTAGTYSVTVSNAQGCASSTSINVSTNPLPVATITENTTICQGQSATLSATYNAGYTYHWSNGNNTNSITVNTPGSYTVTVTNSSSCSVVLSTTLTVNERPQVSISGSTSICAGETTQLTASANMPCSYIWSSGDTNSITTVSSSNTYRVTAYNAFGCSNTANRTVVVHPLPIPYITGSTTICRGNSTTLTATGGVSYMWSNGHTSAQISVSPSSNLTYTVTATDQFGCRANVSATVTVNVIPSINILGNRSFCEGGSTTLTATGGSYYTWSNGENTHSISISQVGTYSVTATNSLGCQNTESVLVTSMNLPSITISGKSNICEGNTDTLTAGGATQYVWSTGETSSTIQVMPTTTTTYTVTGYGYNGCLATASKVVNIDAKPTVQINGTTTICEGESTTLTAIGGTSYQWVNGSTSDHISVTQSGNYAVIATNAAGCSNSASLAVTVNPSPRISLTGATTFCSNSTSTIMASGGSTYHWSNGSNQSSLVLTTGGDYSVTTTNNYGCSSDTSFTVTTLTVPNAEITGTFDLCEGEAGYLTVSENAQYSWSNGSTSQTINITPFETSTYFVTVTHSNGCSNYSNKTVTLHPNFQNQFTAEICQGSSFNQYSFNIPTQDEPGTFVFVDSLQSVYGCDSISTLTLTVKPVPVINSGISGNAVVSNYGNFIYQLTDVSYANIFEWSISNPRWTLSNSNINSVFLNIQSSGNGTLMVKAINSCGYADTSLLIRCNVGVEEYTNDTRILVYPNPVSQSLNINFENASLQIRNIELIDQFGRCVLRNPVTETQTQVDCTPFANGAYVLRMIDADGKAVDHRKIIINK